MRVRLSHSFLIAAAALSLSSAATAHFNLKAPAPSTDSDNGGKGGPPCGPDNASAVVTPVMGGTMLPIMIEETVFHPGHYRIALSITSRAQLPVEPVVKDADGKVLTPVVGPGNSETAAIQSPAVFPVLADNLFPHTSDMSPFSGQVLLPNINCDKCTLQVLQFMSKHSPDYFYRHCADLKITADPSKPIFDPNGGVGGSGGAGGSGGGAGMAGTGGQVATAGTGGQVATAGTGGVAGGAVAAGGAPAATGGAPGGAGGIVNPTGLDDSGCSCSTPSGRSGNATLVASTLLLGLGLLRRRRAV